MEQPKTKVCSKCGRELPITEFALNKTCKDGHTNKCKECYREYARELYARKKKNVIHANTTRTSTIPPMNPKFLNKSPRELQDDLRELKKELIARGFNCSVKLSYLHEIII